MSKDVWILSVPVKALVKNGWAVLLEPTTPTPAGLRRSDIVAWNETGICYAIDATIVPDNADLHVAHGRNVEYYDTQHVGDWVARVSGAANVSFSSITLNWRGTLAPPSFSTLKYDLGLSKSLLQLLSMIVVEKGFHMYLL